MNCEPRPNDVAVGLVIVDDQNARWSVHGNRLRDVLLDLRQELAWAERLRHIIVATSAPCFFLVPAQRVRSYDDDRNGFEQRIRLDPPRRLVAVDDGQLNI